MGIAGIILLLRIVSAYQSANRKIMPISNNTLGRRGIGIRASDTTNGGSTEPFKLMELPYGMGDLSPQISEETVKFHYLKHHAGYVKKLNELSLKDPEIAKQTLDELVKRSQGVVYNMAAQIWNHDFYWLGLAPNSNVEDAPETMALIQKTFGSLQELKTQLTSAATAHFGSGWVWLLYDKTTDSLQITSTKDAGNPIRTMLASPILVLDVWEHAYYIDYRNDKAVYTEAWFQKINWKRVEQLIKHYRNL